MAIWKCPRLTTIQRLAITPQASEFLFDTDEEVYYGGDGTTVGGIAFASAAGTVTSVFTRTGSVVATNGDYTASQITNVPAGDISAITVQAAIDELDSEKISKVASYAQYDATGVVSGGLVTLNIDTTKIDISPAIYFIQGVRYTYAGVTGYTPLLGIGESARRLALDSTGLVSQQGEYSNVQKQTNLPIARVQAIQGQTGSGSTLITPIDTRYLIGQEGYLERVWKEQVFGVLYPPTGGEYSEGTPLYVNQASGTFFDAQGKLVSIAAQSNITAKYVYHVAGVYAVQPNITLVVNTTQYDNGTGLTALSNSHWVAHTLLRSPKADNEFFVILGNAEYVTQTEAEASPINYAIFGSEAISGLVAVARFIVRNGSTSINRLVNTQPRLKGETAEISGVSARLPTVSNPTEIVNYEDAWTHFNSSSVSHGCETTDNGDGTFSIALGEVVIRSADLEDAPLAVYYISASGTLTPADNDVTYYYIDYNNGNPIWASGTSIASYNGTNKVQGFTVGRRGTTLWIVDARAQAVDGGRKTRRRDLEWSGNIQRGFWHTSGGTTIGSSGLAVSLTAGKFYYSVVPVPHIAFDTSIAGLANPNVFDYYYNSSSFTAILNQKTINNSQYDNAGVLTNLTVNKFRTDWMYLILDGLTPRLIVRMGTAQTNSLTDAQAVSVPSSVPGFMDGIHILVGQIVVQQGASVLTVTTALGSAFVSTPVTVHNSLSSIQGGTTNEYYHLTSAQNTALTTGVSADAYHKHTLSGITNTNKIGVATGADDLNEITNLSWSSGVISGCAVTDNLNGTVSIAAGEAMLRSSASESAQMYLCAIAANPSVVLTDLATNYICADYNAGTPTISVYASIAGFNCMNICIIAAVSREGLHLHIIDATRQNVDGNRKLRRKYLETDPFKWTPGGSIIGSTGLAITLTAGKFWFALDPLSHGAFDTSLVGTGYDREFSTYYRNGVGGWTKTLGVKVLNNTQYDDGDGTLATVGNNKYLVHWIFLALGANAHLATVYGQAEFTNIADAQASSIPSILPPVFAGTSVLVGRAIILKSDTVVAVMESPFSTTFSASTPSAHNNLSSLQGGVAGEYYHLSSAEYIGSGTGIFVKASSPAIVTPTIAQINGATTASGTLTLQSTTNATKGKILFGTSAYDEVNNLLGLGTTSPEQKLHIVAGNIQIDNGQQVVVKDSGGVVRTMLHWDTADLLSVSSNNAGSTAQMKFMVSGTERVRINNTGNVGIATASPTAKLHLPAGTATAGTAPLKLTSGTALATPEDGVIEYHGSHLYFTIGGTRYQIDQQSGAVAGADQVARDQIALTNLRLFKETSLTTGAIAQGRLWGFESDEWGSSSTGETWNAAGYYHNPEVVTSYANAGGTGDRTTSITTALTPTPGSGTSSALVDGIKDGANGVLYSGGQTGVIFGFDFGVGDAKIIQEAKVYINDDGFSQGTYQWSGSSDGVSYTNIGGTFDMVNTVTGTAGYCLCSTLSANTTAYRYYNCTQTSGATTNAWIDEFEFKLASSLGVPDMTLIPTAVVSVVAVPVWVDAFALYKDDSGTAVLGTDFTGELSANSGTNYTVGTITTVAVYSGDYTLIKIRADVSANPGTNLICRLKVLGKVQRVAGVILCSE